MRIILASKSPRRIQILRDMGAEFDVIPANCNEICNLTNPAEIVECLAQRKARFVAENVAGPAMIIGSDTLVYADGEVLGKPADTDDARRMLDLLRKSWHTVYTGVCVLTVDADGKCAANVYHETADVFIRNLTDEQIDAYIATGEPMDKAGAYAIQGKQAARLGFVEEYRGEFNTIVGLPTARLSKILPAK